MTSFRQFLREAKQRDSYWIEKTKADFAVAIDRILAKTGVNQRELAAKLGTSPAYITKVLRGNSNLTIESMVKLARAVGGNLSIQVDHPALHATQDSKRTGPVSTWVIVYATNVPTEHRVPLPSVFEQAVTAQQENIHWRSDPDAVGQSPQAPRQFLQQIPTEHCYG